MSGIAGIANYRRNLYSELENLRNMTEILSKRGNSSLKIKNAEYALFGCTAMIYCDNPDKQIPLSVRRNGTEYTVCFDGLLYNSSELKDALSEKGFRCEDADDAELVLLSYIRWGAGCLNRLNGIFAFSVWNSESRELFLARDRFGIKPLYYTQKNGCIIFASELKGILANNDVEAVLDRDGLCEVLGLGPAHTCGCGVFKGINEILPGHFAVYNKNGFNCHRYWVLESKAFMGDFDECVEETKRLCFDAINKQLEQKNRRLAFFLSGGLDSSIITALAAKKFGEGIDTFSLRYIGNDEFFTPTEYQPASDDYFIDIVSRECQTNHNIITVDNDSLIDYLTDAVDCRDLPGMADVDSSLYFLCREMGTEHNGALSGECADEIFGGYPWFHRKEDFDADIFPWSKNTEHRRNLVCSDLLRGEEIVNYAYDKYRQSIAETPVFYGDTPEEKRRREIAYLNIRWFMYSLGARSERIGMNCGLEIRMPFCDHKIVEYMWSVPWDFKAWSGREKGLLRTAFEGILPQEVLWRKKSPFPKTHNPEYEYRVRDMACELLNNKNSRIYDIINKDYIFDIAKMSSDYGKPWFGQLMATPQLYGYLIQLEYWLKKYNVRICIN